MKTITEFTASSLQNAFKTKQELVTGGKTAEELPAAMGEALKLEGDKLTLLLSALEVVEKKSQDLKRVVVWKMQEGETAPRGTEQKGEHHFILEYFPPMPGREPKRGGKGHDKRGDRKGGRGGKGGKRGGGREGGRDGARAGERDDRGRGPRRHRPEGETAEGARFAGAAMGPSTGITARPEGAAPGGVGPNAGPGAGPSSGKEGEQKRRPRWRPRGPKGPRGPEAGKEGAGPTVTVVSKPKGIITPKPQTQNSAPVPTPEAAPSGDEGGKSS